MTREEILLLRVVKKVTTREDPQLASFDLKRFILHSNKSQTPSMHQFKAKNMYETHKQQIKTLISKNNKYIIKLTQKHNKNYMKITLNYTK